MNNALILIKLVFVFLLLMLLFLIIYHSINRTLFMNNNKGEHNGTIKCRHLEIKLTNDLTFAIFICQISEAQDPIISANLHKEIIPAAVR
jgi:hypothetical protein